MVNKKIKVLSIYRGLINDNRGTPIKVRSLSSEFEKRSDIDFSLCAWDLDKDVHYRKYFKLTNDHLDDLKRIYKYIKQNKIDVVIGHTMATYYYLFPLKFLTRAKIVLEMQGYIEEESKFYGDINIISYYWSKFIYGLFYRVCDLITTCSDTSTEIISQYNKNVVTIWGGVDISVFNPDFKSESFIEKNPNEIIVGYAGNARLWQGLPFLIESYIDLKSEYPEFKLALLCSEKKLEQVSGITYFDKVPHEKMPTFFADCDILVIPRMHNEVNRISFPSKLIEYMAMGKAVVSSSTSDAHKIIRNGINGLVFEPGDKNELKKALVSLRDINLRRRLGNEAWNTIKNGFTWEHHANIFVVNLHKLFE